MAQAFEILFPTQVNQSQPNQIQPMAVHGVARWFQSAKLLYVEPG